MLKVYNEKDLRCMCFYSGANYSGWPTDEQFNKIQDYLEEICPKGISEDELNKIFTYDDSLIHICSMCGLRVDFDNLKIYNKESIQK